MEPQDDFEVGDLAQRLRLAVGNLARRMRQIHASAGPDEEIRFNELAVLSRLDRLGPTNPAALARSEQVSPQAIGTVLSGLAERGLVSRVPDQVDRRRVVATVTPAGRLILASRSHHVSARLEQALGEGFSPAELLALRDIVPLLERLAGQV